MPADWNLPEREVTPESALLSRRRWIKRAGIGAIGLGVAGAGYWWWRGSDEEILARGQAESAEVDLFPAELNPEFDDAGRAMTVEATAARHTNFYEFAATKDAWRYVGAFKPQPWKLEIGGLVARPRTLDFDQLMRLLPLEERIYRHRCVETWAMVVPWTGFPLARLLALVEPLPEAKFVRFVSFQRPREARRQQSSSEPWPYMEGLTLAEAANELAFIATGMYGHPLLKQHGAPIRLVVPWKYGFKSAKSIVRIELTADQPATFWNTLVPREYAFEANVNPDVPHPRWSQKRERMLGTGESFTTKIYNGYGEWVGKLYG